MTRLVVAAVLVLGVAGRAWAQPGEPPVPPLTDAERAAAFPEVHPHHARDEAVYAMLLFDQLEWQTAGRAGDVSLDTTAWIGTDRHRFWFRGEGDRAAGHVEQAQLQFLYGRAMWRWFNLMAGIRQDVRPGAPRTAGAIGVHGTAPYFLHLEASLFAEPNGRTHVRVETEYELLLTNRLVLQPLIEFEVYSRSDPALGLARGLSTADAGLRLRYEIRRELAPYIGVVWHRAFFGTADRTAAQGRRTRGVALAAGLRFWL